MSNLMEEVKCPICIDTLKKPIRMLPCGHNLCHSCLVDLCHGFIQENCPTCRRRFQLGVTGANSLPRNRTVENMIDRLANTATQSLAMRHRSRTTRHQTRRSHSLGKEDQLKAISTSYFEEGKYSEAAEILNVLINQSDGFYKVKPIIKRAKCLLEIGEVKEAKNLYCDLVAIIDSSENIQSMKDICTGCDEDIKCIVEDFVKDKEYDVGIKLTNCLFKITKFFYSGEVKLLKLGKLGGLIENTAIKMNGNYKGVSKSRKPVAVAGGWLQDLVKLDKSRRKQFKKQFCLLEEILEEMRGIHNIDVGVKCLEVVRMLKHVEFCSYNIDVFSNYQKSVDTNKQAITLMETVFGENASKYKLFGFCHKDLGCALLLMKKNEKAKKALLKSIAIYDKAIDWSNTSEHEESVTFAVNEMIRIDKY